MMKITLQTVTIGELVAGFKRGDEVGVVGYDGKLNIRPPYQREFVYKPEQQKAVIESIFKNFPLNVMYWIKNVEGTFELLDGQQRTLSICNYYTGEFDVTLNDNVAYYANLTSERKQQFLDYKLQVYVCEDGTQEEKLDWFQIINIAGERLTSQEVRNAIYSGPWVTEAKKFFSKTNCVAYQLGEKYLVGSPIRQNYFETVLKWIYPIYNEKSIDSYMATRQLETNADREKKYFREVINWVESTFLNDDKSNYRKEMNGLPWGILYNKFHTQEFSQTELEKRIKVLFEDDEVTNKSGIYEYVLSGDERKLSLRAFTTQTAREAYERQNGICKKCGLHFEFEQMQADHITPWSKGGKTISENCQMLCTKCNRIKSNK